MLAAPPPCLSGLHSRAKASMEYPTARPIHVSAASERFDLMNRTEVCSDSSVL